MVAPPLVLGLDLGTTRMKARLIGGAGHEAGAAAVATPWQPNAELTVDRLHGALRALLTGLGDARRQVASVGIAGMAESGAPLDGDGRAVGPVIAWHDPRGGEVVDRLVAEFGDQLPRWIGQPVRTVSSVAKLGWLVGHAVGRVDGWLGVPELCLHRLTGSRVTEYSLAARTGCYHVGECRYLSEVAAAAGIRPGVFPPVEPAGTVMGRISADGAAWSGLPAGIPVTLAGHDHVVGMMGCGAGRRDLVNSVGTAESVVAGYLDLPDIKRALARRVAVTVMPAGDGWALLAGAARAGMILAALAERLGCAPGELDRLAKDPGPGAAWSAELHTLSVRTWEAVGRIAGLTGTPPRLVVFGGGSHSRPWLDEKAGIGWLPVWRSTAAEAVARGAALHAGVAAGWWPSTGAGPQATLEMVRR